MTRIAVRHRLSLTALLAGAALALAAPAASAQQTAPDPADAIELRPIIERGTPTPEPQSDAYDSVTYTSRRTVTLPFSDALYPPTSNAERAAGAVALLVSGNRGRSWVRAQKRALPAETLEFAASNDGEFWCRFQREPRERRIAMPASGAEPHRIVVVDTAPPEIAPLTVSPPDAEGRVVVSWQATDDSPIVGHKAVAALDRDHVAMPVSATRGAAGSVTFRLTEPGTHQVAVQLLDAAGNTATATSQVTVAPPPPPQPPEATHPPPSPVAPGAEIEPPAQVRSRQRVSVLSSRTLRIGYAWDDADRPDRVGLWVTRDGGRSWRLAAQTDELTGVFLFEAPEDGVYGFRTHREICTEVIDASTSGIAPEREIIVDTTPPQITWLAPAPPAAPGEAPSRARPPVHLAWRVDEATPSAAPGRLEYRAFRSDAWQHLAEVEPRDGTFTWLPPADVRGAVEVRLTLTDEAGHVGWATLPLALVRDDIVPSEPSPPAATDPRAIDAARKAYAVATFARMRDDWAGAEKHLQRATSLDPSYAKAWVDLGGVYLRDRRWAAAVDVYRKALELEPESNNAGLGLARALAARNDLDGAAETLSDLVGRSETDADAWLLYGDVLYKSGDPEGARRCWRTALGLGGGRTANVAAIEKRLELLR